VDVDVVDQRASAGLHKRMVADQERSTVNAVSILSRLLVGAVLGVFFYVGLWVTVRALLTTRHPTLLTLGSFWIRTLVVLASFLFLMKGRWQYALTCVVGFMIGRIAVSKSLRVQAARTKCP
jgi:F1F0 ATPase subunit 2